MGGRGSSSGVSISGKPYGTEYETLLAVGNIKFLRYKDSSAAKAPMETMTKGRVYATIDSKGDVKYITYYDKANKRFKQIDIKGQDHYIDGKPVLPHTHLGYVHDENGTRTPNSKEQKMIDRVLKAWQNKKGE